MPLNEKLIYSFRGLSSDIRQSSVWQRQRGNTMLRSCLLRFSGMAALLTGLTATAADASSGIITVISASSPASSVGSLSVEPGIHDAGSPVQHHDAVVRR